MGESVHIIEKNKIALLFDSKEIAPEVNADETKYIVKSLEQNTRRNKYVKIDNSSFERVDEFRYVGTT